MAKILNIKSFNHLYLIIPPALFNLTLFETVGKISIDEFLSCLNSSDLSLLDFLKNNSETNCKNIENLTKIEFLKRHCILTSCVQYKSFLCLNSAFRRLQSNIDMSSSKIIDVYNYTTLAEAAYSLLLKAVHRSQNSLPCVFNMTDGSIFSTSKFEISVCKIISQEHYKRYGHKIMGYPCGNGEQFKIDNLSIDVFCIECQSGIFIEGNYKMTLYEMLYFFFLFQENSNIFVVVIVQNRTQTWTN